MVSTSATQLLTTFSSDEKDDINFMFHLVVEFESHDPMGRSFLVYFRKHMRQKDIFIYVMK